MSQFFGRGVRKWVSIMMDNGSRRPHVVTKEAYDLLCEPLCASDLRDLHELLSKPSVKKYFANTFGAESEMDVDWTKKVWAPYVEFLTGRNEKGEDIPDKPGVFFSSCSSWVANFDPEICADAPETRPEELWKRSLKDLPLRGNIVMLYLNWGGDLSRKRSADDNGDWTGLYGSEKESKSQRSVAWRNFHTKKEVTQWRAPRSRFFAMAAGPIAGAYWTDFYKFIPTPDQSSLNNFLKFAKNEKIYDELEKLMLTLFDHELERLDGNAHPTPSQESRDFNRLILATTDPYDILRSHDLSKYGFKPLKPWCLIRWPHHSGQSATFKATTLAYAYGRVARALWRLDACDDKSYFEAGSWPWPFGFELLSGTLKAADNTTLHDWLARGSKSAIFNEYMYPELARRKDAPCKFPKKSTKNPTSTSYVKCAEAEKKYPDESATHIVERILIDFTKDKDGEVQKEWKNLKKSFAGENPSTKDVIDRIYAKKMTTSSRCDTAFLLGWCSEELLLENGSFGFDETLMPPIDVLDGLIDVLNRRNANKLDVVKRCARKRLEHRSEHAE